MAFLVPFCAVRVEPQGVSEAAKILTWQKLRDLPAPRLLCAYDTIARCGLQPEGPRSASILAMFGVTEGRRFFSEADLCKMSICHTNVIFDIILLQLSMGIGESI